MIQNEKWDNVKSIGTTLRIKCVWSKVSLKVMNLKVLNKKLFVKCEYQETLIALQLAQAVSVLNHSQIRRP